MSDILHEDTFHATKKGGRRKTVSKRRAYVNTPSQIRKQLAEIQKVLQGNPSERRWRQDGVSPADTEEALSLIKQLSSQLLYGFKIYPKNI